MHRWLAIALIGILISLYTNNILHVSLKMPSTFDYTKVDQETVLTPALAMLGGKRRSLASRLIVSPADRLYCADSITQQSWGLGGTGAALANLYQRKL